MRRIKSKYCKGDRVYYYDVNTGAMVESEVTGVTRRYGLVKKIDSLTGIKTLNTVTLEHNKVISERILKSYQNAVFIGKYYVMLPVLNTYYNLKSVDGGDNYTCGWYDDECIQVDYLDAIDGVNADLIAKTEQELLKRKFDGLYDKLDESKTENGSVFYQYNPKGKDLDNYDEEDKITCPAVGSKFKFRFAGNVERDMRLTEVEADERYVTLTFDLDKNNVIYKVGYTILVEGSGYQNVFTRLRNLGNVVVKGLESNRYGLSYNDKLIKVTSAEFQLGDLQLFSE